MTAISLPQSGASLLPNAGIGVFCCYGAECYTIALGNWNTWHSFL